VSVHFPYIPPSFLSLLLPCLTTFLIFLAHSFPSSFRISPLSLYSSLIPFLPPSLFPVPFCTFPYPPFFSNNTIFSLTVPFLSILPFVIYPSFHRSSLNSASLPLFSLTFLLAYFNDCHLQLIARFSAVFIQNLRFVYLKTRMELIIKKQGKCFVSTFVPNELLSHV
jgi:hypothetical protein